VAAAGALKYTNERRFKHICNIDINGRVQQYHLLPIFWPIKSETMYRRAADSNLKAAHRAPIPRYDILDLGFAVVQYVTTGPNVITSHEAWRDARRRVEHRQGVHIDAGAVNERPWARGGVIYIFTHIIIIIIIIMTIIISGDPNIFVGSIIIIIIITRVIDGSRRHITRRIVVDQRVHWQQVTSDTSRMQARTINGCMLQLLHCDLLWFPSWLCLLAFLSTGSHLGLGPWALGPEMPM
jgi:hypothetical protein